MQRRHVLVAALCVVVGICVFGTAGAGAKTDAACDTQANDTPGTLLPCITKSDLQGYMTDLWDIATAPANVVGGHPSRNSGEPGYKASADYVANLMQQWGYTVRLQPYTFLYTAFTDLPTFSGNVGGPFTLNDNWTPAPSNGSVTAEVEPAGGIVLPPTPAPSSSSGCTAADFAGFTPGKIALIQRGTCNFGVKVINAKNAGAAGVIIFNEGNPNRTGLQGVSLADANNTPFAATIPVVSVTFAVGQALYDAATSGSPPVFSMSVSAEVDPNRLDWNVIADSKGGDKNHTVVIDAHLDAIYGAGMLDNGSGSMSILDIAKLLKNANPTNHLRFIWFGGEELGLFGSQFYVNNLSPTEASHIGYDLDADVTATPNYTLGILDPAAKDLFSNATTADTFPNRVYKASLVGRDAGIAYLNSQQQNHELFSPEGTDAYEFNLIGVPASGVLTGQDCCKTQAQVDLFAPNNIGTVNEVGNFEGNLGTSDGGCVDNSFLWCDNLDNNNFDVMTLMTRDFANMVLTMAYDTKVMSASGSAVINKKTALSQETGSRHIASS
jgi:Zn-dependent M28 family amino/carboxypeptidase